VRPGELVVLAVETPGDAAVRARAFNRALPVFRVAGNQWRVLAGVDLDAPPGTHRVMITAGRETALRDLVVSAKRFPTRRLTVDEDFVTPPPSAAERIAAETRLLNDTWQSTSPERQWAAAFVRPVPQPANSAFG